jgi:chemotaxis response regulator CheB
MDERRIVVLFGDSLLMDTVEASLGEDPELTVVRIHNNVGDVIGLLASLRPDVIIFDLDTAQTEFLLPQLREHPGVPLLGLDINSSTVVALSSKRYTTPTAHDLAQVIQTQASEGVRERQRSYLALNDQVRELLERWL